MSFFLHTAAALFTCIERLSVSGGFGSNLVTYLVPHFPPPHSTAQNYGQLPEPIDALISLMAPAFLLVLALLLTAEAFVSPANLFTHSHHRLQISSSLSLKSPLPPLSSSTDGDNLEFTWRNIKRPLLSISNKKGVSDKHRNNFRTLLEDHKVVKVKFSGVLENETALDEMINSLITNEEEVLRMQKHTGVVLFGLPGMRDQIATGVWQVKEKRKWLRKPLGGGKDKTRGSADSVEVD